MMRRAIVIMCMLAGFLLAGQTSYGVEKVEKKKSTTTQPKPSDPKKTTPAPKPTPPPPKKSEPSKKKYDDFIDKNKNGVDDRKEKPGK